MPTRRRNVSTLALSPCARPLDPAARGRRGPGTRAARSPPSHDARQRGDRPLRPDQPPPAPRPEARPVVRHPVGRPAQPGTHPNFYRNGGLYGIPWKANHTASIYPYFFGAPGQNTLNPDDRRIGYLARLPKMLFHPFKPIGMYYDQGSYVPVYDLDPLVSGPTAWPFPVLPPAHRGRRLTTDTPAQRRASTDGRPP